jgi:hypothetical protein
MNLKEFKTSISSMILKYNTILNGINTRLLLWSSILFLFVFSYITFNFFIENKLLDIYHHFGFVEEIILKDRRIPPNYMLYLLSSLPGNIYFARITFLCLLALAVCLKFYFTLIILKENIIKLKINELIALSMAFVFAFNLPSISLIYGNLYRYNYAMTSWHNSTIIFLLPFALMLFYFLFSKELNRKNIIITFILILLNISIKPSFIFVIIPILGFIVVKDFFLKSLTRKDLYFVAYGIFSVLLIFIQYYVIYIIYQNQVKNVDKITIELTFIPFTMFYKIKLLNLPFALIFSYLFPIAYFISVHRRKITLINVLTIFSVIIAILIYFVVSETGIRRHHGNFYWQIIPSSFIIYLFTFISFIQNSESLSTERKSLLKTIFALNVLFGIAYLVKIFLFKDIY